MIATALAALALAAPSPQPAVAAYGNTTAYCLRGTMADGTWTRDRSAAHNGLPLGSKIKLNSPGTHGWRIFYIRDRIGHGTSLDLWARYCGEAHRFGRRSRSFKVLRYGR